MTGLGMTGITLKGVVVSAIEHKVADLFAVRTELDLLWDVAPAVFLTGLLFLIGVRLRQHRIAQKRDKDWRQRRDLRSRGA